MKPLINMLKTIALLESSTVRVPLHQIMTLLTRINPMPLEFLCLPHEYKTTYVAKCLP